MNALLLLALGYVVVKSRSERPSLRDRVTAPNVTNFGGTVGASTPSVKVGKSAFDVAEEGVQSICAKAGLTETECGHLLSGDFDKLGEEVFVRICTALTGSHDLCDGFIGQAFREARKNDEQRHLHDLLNYGLNGPCAVHGRWMNDPLRGTVWAYDRGPFEIPRGGVGNCVKFANGCKPNCPGTPGCAEGTHDFAAAHSRLQTCKD